MRLFDAAEQKMGDDILCQTCLLKWYETLQVTRKTNILTSNDTMLQKEYDLLSVAINETKQKTNIREFYDKFHIVIQ